MPVTLQNFDDDEMTCIWLGDRSAIAVSLDLLTDGVRQQQYMEGRRLPSNLQLPIERFLGRDVPWVVPK